MRIALVAALFLGGVFSAESYAAAPSNEQIMQALKVLQDRVDALEKENRALRKEVDDTQAKAIANAPGIEKLRQEFNSRFEDAKAANVPVR